MEKPMFHPILMHFAARHAGFSYAEFASDYRALVKSNLKCLEDFQVDSLGLISDPYRETAAFGAEITYPDEAVPRCRKAIVETLEDVQRLKPDIVDLDWMLDMDQAHDILGPGIIRCGNLDPVSVILNKSPEAIFEESRSLCLKEQGRGFILSGGCEITVNTPPANLKAMQEAAL
jgi:uroporphyrinogen-III decarboxylase